jgi:glutamine synthetase
MSDAPPTADDVISIVNEKGIRFVRLWFTDILGQLKAFSINATELRPAARWR